MCGPITSSGPCGLILASAAINSAQLARAVTGYGFQIVEAARIDAKANRGIGKFDLLAGVSPNPASSGNTVRHRGSLVN